ncbi:MAG: septum formation initiator family protein [Myxococcaceae bacterium]|nr:septum formation initiator family protein [Myxococcaceae bacterium]
MPPRRKVLWAAVILAGVLTLGSITAEGGFRRYLSLRAEVSSLKERQRSLKDENTRLRREAQALQSDAAAQERAAREAGFVKPDEVIIHLEGK